ncbi:S-adenosyl-L-methionine-dependent methyltransferase [Annulohypoxylon truncatum]|uniref:S-adenosyl-L-methionine-dependent methyltransferase n=1 Tax=Annulohypoxylon truncatum TaxID=327061 RepID=UPI0020089779|nr:S-adenosyl-L-methionine-dependent methyltransferase [Annulohypoxylon truncatum]KAI1206848.1 S-adenosyl-L-methionine-dependent methyltransferase [Annulohypoxylon truncatum]
MTVTALADIIRRQAEILETSLPRHAYTDYHGDKSLSIARSKLLEACDKLNHLVTDVMGIAQGHRVHAALQYVCHFRLAHFVPADGTPIPYAELARAAGVDASQCARVLQLLMTYHIFREPGTRIVAHNRNSRVLLDEDTGAAVEWLTQESLRSSAFFTEARAMSTRRWSTGGTGGVGLDDVAIDSGRARAETALGLAPGAVDQPAFGFITQQRQTTEESMKADRYARAMAGMAKRRQLSAEHLVSGFDWAGLPPGSTVVDVGGGNGHCSKAVAYCNPTLKFIVQDANAAFAEQVGVDELGDRLQFMTYDFFTPQPATGDVYLLRRILHHHSDQDAVRILQAQLGAVRKKPSSRIVVMDNIAIHSGTLSTLEERKTRTLDIAMMALFNSVERDLKDWKELFRMADPQLKLVNVTSPIGSALAVMELALEQT